MKLALVVAILATVAITAQAAGLIPVRLTNLKAVPVDVQPNDVCNGDDYGTSGDFDFYVFQQEWPAEFCSGQDYPLCNQPTPFMKTNLAIHGLWPNYAEEQDGHDWPQCCQSVYGPGLNQTAINMVADDMHEYWPDEQADPGYNTSAFWAHEWGKHGTCSGLDQFTYFSSAIAVEKALGTPAVITENAGGQVDLLTLYTAYEQPICDSGSDSCMVSLDCNSDSNGLNTVTTCWDKELSIMPCPNEVIMNDSCPDSVTIASF